MTDMQVMGMQVLCSEHVERWLSAEQQQSLDAMLLLRLCTRTRRAHRGKRQTLHASRCPLKCAPANSG